FFGIVATFPAGAAKNKIQPESWKAKIRFRQVQTCRSAKRCLLLHRAKRTLPITSAVPHAEPSSLCRLRFVHSAFWLLLEHSHRFWANVGTSGRDNHFQASGGRHCNTGALRPSIPSSARRVHQRPLPREQAA